jgi:uncharacterized protein YxeA
MKKLIPILLIVISVGCSTTTTNIQKVENYNDNKVLETNNSVVRVDEPDMNGVVLGEDERDIDYYDLFYKIGVIGLVILSGSSPQ